MQITLFIDELRSGGAEGQMLMLARGLQSEGHQVRIVVFYPTGDNFENATSLEGIEVSTLFEAKSNNRLVSLYRHRSGALRLRQLLKSSEKPNQRQVVYSFLEWPNVIARYAASELQETDIVWGVRGADDQLSKWRALAFSRGVKKSNTVDLIISNSEKGLAWHKKVGFRPRHWAVIENGIDVARFGQEDSELERLRSDLSLHDGLEIVGIVGRLVPVKDHSTFLKAIAILAESKPNLRILIAGTSENDAYEASLKETAENHGLSEMVTWMGHVAKIENIYKVCDVVALTSISEGFPNAICEAMACGVPCVSTDVGDAAKIVGEMGKIVPVGDVKAIANAIQEILDDLDRYPPKQLRKSIVDRYSVKSLAKRTVHEIEKTRVN